MLGQEKIDRDVAARVPAFRRPHPIVTLSVQHFYVSIATSVIDPTFHSASIKPSTVPALGYLVIPTFHVIALSGNVVSIRAITALGAASRALTR